MSEYLLSVIVPTYNVERYVQACIDSLLDQLSGKFEIIIINDSSTDDTLRVLERFYRGVPQVRIETVVNGGAGLARDRGVALARGEFLFFCDPDDIVAGDITAELAEVLRAQPETELFCFSSQMFAEENRADVRPKVRHTLLGASRGIEVLSSLLRNGSYTSAAWNYAVKRSLVMRHHLRFEKRQHEDHLFSLGVFLHSQQSWVSRQVYYHQRIRSGSLTNSHKGNDYFYQRYDAFMHSWHKMVTTVDKSALSLRVRREYLLHSFRLMIYLSLYNGTAVPKYVLDAIRFLGREIRPVNFKEWLLLKSPEVFVRFQQYKVGREVKSKHNSEKAARSLSL
ncbi:glycosyltransferase family 2 protein [Pantoea sp. A4]|uniref:glycosyltransferase family 2 protein n=1 Tax=Pantoea sp. A4 TaxID=1225184 RepID=UPI0003813C8B|nr:glycosyltransferase family 2 protein [Pantoea sp. A4]